MIAQKLLALRLDLKGLFIGLGLLGFMASSILLIMSGTKTGAALGFALIIAPVAIYLAIARPLVFPFCLYVVLVPFDNLLVIPHWGTLTKFAALGSGAAVAFWVVRKKQVLGLRRPVIQWGILILWAAATFSWAMDINDYSVSIFATLVQLFVLYLAFSLIPVNDRDLSLIFLCVVLGAVLAAAYGDYLFRHGTDVYGGRLFLGASSLAGSRQGGSNSLDLQTSINPNSFAAALLLPISLALMQFLSTWRPWVKLAWSAVLVLLLSGIVVAGSRGSFLAVATLGAFYLWKSRYKAQMLALAVCAGIGSLFVSSIWARLALALSNGGAGRLSIWSVGIRAFKQHWLLGAGEGEFQDAYDKVYISVFQQFNAHWHRPAHDLMLGAAVELGIIGAILMLWAWIAQYKILDMTDKRNPYYDIAVTLQGAIVSLFVACLFLDGMYEKYTWLIFVLIMLTASRIAQYSKTTTDSMVALRPPTWQSSRLERDAASREPVLRS